MLTEKDRQVMRRAIKKHRAAANSIRNGVIPARGYTFDDGETFAGVLGSSIALNAILNAHIGEQLNPGKLPSIGQFNGVLSYYALGDKPDLTRFLTSKDIENKASHTWVQNYLKKHLKKSAFKAGG